MLRHVQPADRRKLKNSFLQSTTKKSINHDIVKLNKFVLFRFMMRSNLYRAKKLQDCLDFEVFPEETSIGTYLSQVAKPLLQKTSKDITVSYFWPLQSAFLAEIVDI